MSPIKIFILIALLLPAVGLMIFGPRADDDLPRDRTVVEYWEKWTGNESEQMKGIVQEFNDTVGREKNIYVRYLSTSSINQKTLVATAAGTPPDIAGLWDSQTVQYAILDALEPLDDLARDAGITDQTYKKVYWDSCHVNGKLYALVSTPGAVALLYNRVAFEQNASALRAAGLDPTRAPRTIQELDAYAAVLDKKGSNGRIERAGFLPMEPNWYVPYLYYWFGATVWDAQHEKFTLTDPGVVASYEWLESYARKLGDSATADFRGGMGTFDSPQNPFLAGTVMMEQQGPWMANYIEHLRPDLNHLQWSKEVEATKSLAERRLNYSWAVAPFPSAVPGLTDVTYATFDTLVIPRGAKHKKEAFTFMAWLSRQDVMEKLCMLHCKNSPLNAVSDNFLQHHPNPYIDAFEKIVRSPNARGVPAVPIWPEAVDEINAIAQNLFLLQGNAHDDLATAQVRLQASYDNFMASQRQRHRTESQ